jgi:Tfp pilus assembly protein PilX
MQAQLVLTLPVLREDRLTAMSQMRRSAVVQDKRWAVILSLQGMREGEVGVLTESGVTTTSSTLIETRYVNINIEGNSKTACPSKCQLSVRQDQPTSRSSYLNPKISASSAKRRYLFLANLISM